MSGELYMLTPITSPMATRPASPDNTTATVLMPPSTLGCTAGQETAVPVVAQKQPASVAYRLSSDSTEHLAAVQANIPQRIMRPATLTLPQVTSSGQGLASVRSTTTVEQQADIGSARQTTYPWTLLSSAVGAAISKVRSASNSPKAQGSQQIAFSADNSSPTGLAALLPEHVQEQAQCNPPPSACAGCSFAMADGGSCSGCGTKFCKSCMDPAATAEGSNGLPAKPGMGGSCTNCSTLCNACKPIACSFCCERVGSDVPGSSTSRHCGIRMCEACADTCDSCKRAACKACAASFVSCSSCGYASCEDCRLQAQVSAGGSHTSGVFGGCWCAPPLRTASNVRHVSSQRYQMSQLHPSVLACSMEAVGLRDADFDDYDHFDTDYRYDDGDDDDQNHQDWNGADDSMGMTASHLGVSAGGGLRASQLSSPNGSGAQGSWLSTQIIHSPASSYSSGGHALYGSYGSYGSSAVAAVIAGGYSGSGRPGRTGAAAGKQTVVRGTAPTTGMVF